MQLKPKQNIRILNYAMLLRITGWLLMVEAGFMLVPMLVAYLSHERFDGNVFAITAGVTAAVGVLMQCIRARHTSMGRREGFILTATVWLWFSVFGMLPFMFGNCAIPLSDAFFEAMSGFTTTGASAMEDAKVTGYGMNIWRAEMQWIGGMGIILFTLAVIPMLNSSGGMQMFNAEVTGITHDKIRPRISSTAKALWGTYIVLTVALSGLLWLGPMDLFESVCYAFSTISTGGFSPTQTPLSSVADTYTYLVLTAFMFLGGVNFSLMFGAACGKVRAVLQNDIFRMYVISIILLTVVFSGMTFVASGFDNTLSHYTVYPLFQVVSTITSTGFDHGCGVPSQPLITALMLVMMFSGACAGSTSGGAKLDRLLCVFKYLGNEVARCVRPNAVMSVRINGRVVSPSIVDKALAFMCLYLLLCLGGGVALSAMGIDAVDAFFSTFSCVSNTGLNATLTGYGHTFGVIPDAGKWMLAAMMMIGRLEIFTVLILFTRSFWRK